MRTRTRPLWAALCAAAGLPLLLAPELWLRGASGRALSATELALSALCTSTALTLGSLCAALLIARPVRDTLGLGKRRLDAAAVAALVAGTAGISHVIDWGVHRLGLREHSVLETIDSALQGAHGWALLLCVAGVALAPGIGEEVLFRGLLMRSLARRFGAAAGIVASAVLFGLLHVELVQGCAAALLGLYLGAVAFVSGGIRTSTLCHVVNNLTAVLVAAAGGDRAEWDQEAILLALGVGGALVGLATLAGRLSAAIDAWKHTEGTHDPARLPCDL